MLQDKVRGGSDESVSRLTGGASPIHSVRDLVGCMASQILSERITV